MFEISITLSSVLPLHDDRYVRACKSIGYEFDINGIKQSVKEGLDYSFYDMTILVLTEKYPTSGKVVLIGNETNNLLNLESFKYYLQMPRYIYPDSPIISKLGFMTFVMNSVIVIGFAMIAQVILCSICAFVISRQLSKRAGNLYLYTKICMPLSKPIISLIALQTFIGNWNDFFWAWLVTEDQTFEAKPGREYCNTKAFEEAIDYCRRSNIKKLTIPKGTYYFKDCDTSAFIQLHGMSNFLLEGEESEFVFEGLHSYLSIQDSSQIMIRNLILDWNWELKPLASVGVVTKVAEDGSYIECSFPE